MRAWRKTIALATLGACGVALPAWAHPNILIRCQVTFLFEGAEIVGLGESWTFDKSFSKELLSDFDRNGDGRLDAAESQAVADDTLPNLAEFRYFTYIWLDGQDLGPLAPRDFAASAHKGLVTFTFVEPLPAPVDPRRQAVKVEIDDREYYAEVDLAPKDPVLLAHAEGLDCTPQVRQDKDNPYFGYVYPQAITLSCRWRRRGR